MSFVDKPKADKPKADEPKAGGQKAGGQAAGEQEHVLPALVRACVAELARRGFDLNRIGDSAATFADIPSGAWRRIAQSIDQADTAQKAYLAVCQRINVDDPVCRVLLDDLAEWLVLPPIVYRRIRSSTQTDTKGQIAA
ncbi:MAG: hypothetical protein ACFHXK_10845 [bacterium]